MILAALMSLCLLFTGCNNEVADTLPSDISGFTSDDSDSGSSSDNDTPPAAEGGFRVDGTKLLDAKGNEFIMRGINHAHVWFKDQLDTALDGIAATGANTVRIVLADGDQWEKTTAENLERTITACNERKMIAVVEVHDACGMDERSYLDNAVDYWVEMADVLAKYADTAILNITNEWIGQWDAETWRDGYTAAIPKLRGAGIKNTIMVDAAGWGQYGESIRKYGKEVFDSDPDKNTMFSIHMYGTAGKNERTIASNLKGVTDQGLCVIVGEFGFNHSDGDVDEAYIMQYCSENGLGYLGWSWKGNGGGVEYLDIAKDWSGNELSEDWGEILVNGDNGIKKNSKICTVFE
ncbi:MAG: glycoside hydrolase family 5 protein [Ruminococcaceae bacterium]|nr:glycoside hydrolase family 5 protein [Oscillospiraceae bacterium]